MRIKPAVASVVGPVSETHWGQILMLPHAYGVVEVYLPSGGALQAGIEILSKLTHRLNEQPTNLAAVAGIAQSIVGEHISSLILLVPVGTVTYIVLRGKGAVYLKRAEKLSVLVEDADGAISGEIQKGDTLLLATGSLTGVSSKDELSAVFDHLKPVEVAEKLTLLLHEKAQSAGGAAFIFQADELVSLEEESLSKEVVAEVAAIAQPDIGRYPAQPSPSVGRTMPRQFLAKVRSFRPHHLSRVPSIVVERLSHQQKPKLIAFISVCLLLLFGVSVVLGIIKQAGNTKAQEVTQAVNDAGRVFEEGTALFSLNPVKGRERLGQAKAMLEPFIKTTSPRSKEGKKLADLYQQINDTITQSLAVTKGEPQLFYDASLLKKGASASYIALSGDTIAIVDAPSRALYTVTISSKNGQVIAGGDAFAGSSLVGIHGDIVYVLTSSGISTVNIKSKTAKQAVIKTDDQWGSIGSLVAFAGNIYLSDITKSRIWKYIATEDATPSGRQGFTDRKEYLNPDTLPDLTKATSMAIDGSVWLGTSDGKILRFVQGKENTFLSQGVEPPFGSNVAVFTSDEVKNLYVLDTQGKRVVVLDKEGLYLAQYVWEGNVTPTQLVVSEENKKVLLLAGGSIYAIELK